MSKPGWKSIPIGAVILNPGNTIKVKTAGWRTFRPVIDHEKCRKCLLCWIYCPEGVIKIVEKDGKIERLEIDYDHCKGCGICAEECPVKAIKMVEEVA